MRRVLRYSFTTESKHEIVILSVEYSNITIYSTNLWTQWYATVTLDFTTAMILLIPIPTVTVIVLLIFAMGVVRRLCGWWSGWNICLSNRSSSGLERDPVQWQEPIHGRNQNFRCGNVLFFTSKADDFLVIVLK